MLVAAIGGAAFGVRHWVAGRKWISTDNAQVEGHIVPVMSRVTAYVAAVEVNDNQKVTAGQELVHFDDRDLRAKLEQADADLAAARAGAGGRGRAGVASAQLHAAEARVAQEAAASKQAESELRRFRALSANGVVSAQQLETAQTSAATARAELAAARDQAVAARAGIQEASGRTASAQAARDAAALQLEYARIVAPVTGTVSRRGVEPGQLVQSGQQLMSLVPLEDVWVVANLKETQLDDVRIGQPVEIRVDSYPGRRFTGVVDSFSPATGAKFSLIPPDNATGNFTKVVQRVPVKIRLSGRIDPETPLRPGMSATVRINAR